MTYHKIQILALKFAEKGESLAPKSLHYGDDEKFEAQRNRLENFFYDFYQGLRKSLNEIEGDLLALKTMNVEPSVLRMLGRVFHQVNDLTKKATPENPYLAVVELDKWLNDKNNKSIIDNLNFIIKSFLTKNKAVMNSNKGIPSLVVKGLTNLVDQIQLAKSYMETNPMLPDQNTVATVPPPGSLMSEQTSISGIPSPDHSKETVPGVYKAIQNLKELSGK